MLFNSFEFVFFFPLITVIFFILPHRHRWVLLLAASYFFYGYWKWEYIFLLLFSTGVDYFAGLKIGSALTKSKKIFYLVLSLLTNLSVLFVFKYFNFFLGIFQSVFSSSKFLSEIPVVDLILPIGISFYTFQTISYSIDVYRGKRPPEKHFSKFALYVSFFPQLVAGPIERSTRLLPQFYKIQYFDWDRIRSGLLLLLWGFFKKVVIADRVGIYVDQVFAEPDLFSSLQLVIAAYFFTYQIYCDFSGYTDIAIGSARVLGFDLMENFRRPTVARTISEFWQNWHISLTKWMTDYLYQPLARRVKNKNNRLFVTVFVFLVIGLWHGAAWNFVFFGLYSGLMLVIGSYTRKHRLIFYHKYIYPRWKYLPKIHKVFQIVFVFHSFVLGAVLFRSTSLDNIIKYFSNLFKPMTFEISSLVVYQFDLFQLTISMIFILLLELGEWFRAHNQAEEKVLNLKLPYRWGVYLLLIYTVILFGEFGLTPFIYFRF